MTTISGFLPINAHLFKHLDAKIIAIDAATIRKSGEHTFGIGKFWSSCDGKAVQNTEYSYVYLIDPNSSCQIHYLFTIFNIANTLS